MTDTSAISPARPYLAGPALLALGVAALAGAQALLHATPPLIVATASAWPTPAAAPSAHNEVAPFILKAANPAERDRAVRCLTDAVYYESAHEPADGQRAVAQVVVNRVRDGHFPKSICGVVYEGWERRSGCQFSFVCDGSIRRRHPDAVAWSRLRPIAEQALDGYVHRAVGAATHYHAEYVKPRWIRTVAETASVGKHVFYSWKGKAGLPAALRHPYLGGEFTVAETALDGVPAPIRHGRRRGPALG